MTLSPKHTQSNTLIQSNIPTSSNHQYKLAQNNHWVCKRTEFLPNRCPYEAGDAFSPSIYNRSYNGVFLNFSSFLTQFYTISSCFSGTWVTLVIHLTQWGVVIPWVWVSQCSVWDNLGMGACLGPRRVVLPWLLIQQQSMVLYLPWFSAPVWFVS